jgi:hypothetical protein
VNREFHPQGTKFTPAVQLRSWGGQSLPLGVKLRIGVRALMQFSVAPVDQRRAGQLLQLGVLRSPHRHWILLHAQPRSWCPQRVSHEHSRGQF